MQVLIGAALRTDGCCCYCRQWDCKKISDIWFKVIYCETLVVCGSFRCHVSPSVSSSYSVMNTLLHPSAALLWNPPPFSGKFYKPSLDLSVDWHFLFISPVLLFLSVNKSVLTSVFDEHLQFHGIKMYSALVVTAIHTDTQHSHVDTTVACFHLLSFASLADLLEWANTFYLGS